MVQRWYVAKVNGVRLAQEQLGKQGFEHWLPEVEVRRVERGKVTKGKRSLFGPYLFVKLDLAASGWRRVNGTRGIERMLPVKSEVPSPVADGAVEALQARAAAGEFTLADAVDALLGYVRGDYVEVRRGAMSGEGGELVGDRGDYLLLLLRLLGRQTVVKVPKSAIDPAPVTKAGGLR